MKPTIVLAFANSADAHLALLKSESSQLMHILGPLHDKGALEVHREESTTVDELIDVFKRFDRRICIFHYAGHAGGEGLKLEEGDAAAAGLAEMLRLQAGRLSLVFLNGCSTLPQVDRLMELGIKAIIATSAPIEDRKAVEFSGWFYQGLIARRTLKDAFEFASAALQLKFANGPKPVVVTHRGERRHSNPSTPDALLWGLYVNGEDVDILDWRIPDTPIQRFLTNPLSDYKPNDYLPKILGAMSRYDPTVKTTIEEIKAGKKDKRTVLPYIVEQLPWTIGAQLQKLISNSDSMRTLGLERLGQIVNTYVITSQVLLYILLSQLWEERRQNGITDDCSALLDVLALDVEGARYFDYVAALANVGRFFKEKGITPFVAEFEELFAALDKKESLFKAYLFLESVREQLFSGKIGEEMAPQLCEEAESSLTIVIGSASFLTAYKMVAVRGISLINHRYREVEYFHEMGNLNAADSAYLKLESQPRSFENHAQSGEVLIVKSLDESRFDAYLSLSPFVVDNNAFLDKSQEALDIYMFSHRKNDEFIYTSVNNQIQMTDQRLAYQFSTGYEERLEVKDELDFGWELNESTTKVVRPYGILKEQLGSLLADLSTTA